MKWMETYAAQRIFMHVNGLAAMMSFGIAFSYGLTLMIGCGIINLVCAWIAHENMKYYKVWEQR